MLHHAKTIAGALYAALLAADVADPHELGVLFRRLHGIAIAGLRVERTDATRDGVRWCVRLLREDDPRILASGEDRAHDD